MESVKNGNAKKFFSVLPLPLFLLIAIILIAAGALLFIYSFVIVAAMKSAMAFLVIFGGSAIAFGAGLGIVDVFIKYLAAYNKKTDVSQKEKKAETQLGVKKFFKLGNIALAVLVIGSISAIISAALGSIERDSWLDAKKSYMEENGYYNVTQPFQTEYYLPAEIKFSGYQDFVSNDIKKITLDLKNKKSIVIYDDIPSQTVKIRGYMKYPNQLILSMVNGELTVSETPSPKLDRVKDKMLFFLFKDNRAEKQIRIIIPADRSGSVEIIGDYILAKD